MDVVRSLFSFLGGSRGGDLGNIFFALSWANLQRDQSVQQSGRNSGIRLGGELTIWVMVRGMVDIRFILV